MITYNIPKITGSVIGLTILAITDWRIAIGCFFLGLNFEKADK